MSVLHETQCQRLVNSPADTHAKWGAHAIKPLRRFGRNVTGFGAPARPEQGERNSDRLRGRDWF